MHVSAKSLCCRYRSLSMLQLPWLSQRRACLLASAYVAQAPLPNVRDLSRAERFAVPKSATSPSMLVNASVQQLQAASSRAALAQNIDQPPCAPGSQRSADDLRPKDGASNGTSATTSHSVVDIVAGWQMSDCAPGNMTSPADEKSRLIRSNERDHLTAAFACYVQENYILLPSHELGLPTDLAGFSTVNPEFLVGIKAGARGFDKLQATLQAAWHVQHRSSFAAGPPGECACMLQALEYARQHLSEFVDQMSQAGWDTKSVIMWSSQRNVLSMEMSDVV
jgi:hypothetical protein